MKSQELFKFKVGDKFIFPDVYMSDTGKVVNHNYHCHILAVIVDNEALQGFTIKRYLKIKQQWKYEFIDVYKVLHRCEVTK